MSGALLDDVVIGPLDEIAGIAHRIDRQNRDQAGGKHDSLGKSDREADRRGREHECQRSRDQYTDEARGSRYAITHPAIGMVCLRQFGDWATAHTIRHNAQAKRVLGS